MKIQIKSKQDICNLLTIPFFAIAIFTVYKGIYHLNVYYKSAAGYADLDKNVYVGGDAYNYIINTNYAADFFILTFICLFVCFALISIGYLDKMANNKKQNEVSHN